MFWISGTFNNVIGFPRLLVLYVRMRKFVYHEVCSEILAKSLLGG